MYSTYTKQMEAISEYIESKGKDDRGLYKRLAEDGISNVHIKIHRDYNKRKDEAPYIVVIAGDGFRYESYGCFIVTKDIINLPNASDTSNSIYNNEDKKAVLESIVNNLNTDNIDYKDYSEMPIGGQGINGFIKYIHTIESRGIENGN